MFQYKVTDVFFDLDHTLWDFERNSEITFGLIFKKHKIEMDLNAFMNIYRPVNLKYWEMYRKEQIDAVNLRYYRLKEVFDTLSYKADKTFIDTIADEYIGNLSNQIHLFEGTLDILNYLSNKYRLHIITNGFEMIQHKKLKSSKIDHFFDTVTTAEGSGHKKPDRRIFDYALQQAKAELNKSVMIGDSLEADIKGAKDYGMHTIYFGKNPNFDTKTIQDLKELKSLL